MKYLLISIAIIIFNLMTLRLSAQPAELKEKLKGKVRVEEIMNIVEEYYEEEGDGNKEEEEDGDLAKWERWGLYMSSRTDGHGRVVDVDRMIEKAYDSYHPTARSSTGSWISRGPSAISGPYGSASGLGRVDRIAFDPSDANIIYAGTPCGGLFKTTNGGTTWSALTDNFPSVAVSGIVVSYADPDVIYILTGDGDSSDGGLIQNSGYWRTSAGVFVSHDSGANWDKTGAFPIDVPYAGFNLAQNPGSANTLLAATTGGLFRTTNGGSTWSLVLSYVTYEVKFKPGSSTIAYATADGKFMRSENGGASWTQISDFDYPLLSGRIAMAVSESFPAYVYLMSGWAPDGSVGECVDPGDMTFGGVYLSSDSGLSFTRRCNTPNIVESCCEGVNSRTQAYYDLALGVSHSNFLNLVSGGINVWRSTNGGLTWLNASGDHCDAQSSSTGFMHTDIHDIEFNPLNNTVYVGGDGGLMKSTNYGVDWVSISSGISASMIYHMAGSQTDIDNIIIGLQDNGCKRRNANTTTWDNCLGGDGFDCIYNWNSSVEGFMGSNSGIYRFWQNGALTSDNLSPTNDKFWRLTTAINDPTIVIAGSNYIYKSINSGNTWNAKYYSGSWDVERCPSNSNRFYAAGGNSAFATVGSMFISNDQGETWTPISSNSGYPDAEIRLTDIGVRPINSSNVWIVFGGFSDGEKVFYSSNAGVSWQNMSGSLPNVPVNAIQIDAANSVYIGTDIGVFYRGAGWNDWVPFWHRLPISPVSDLELYESDDIIRASTFGRGVWESPTYSTCTPGLNLSVNLSGNRYYETSDSIACTSNISGGQNTKVILKANNYIILKAGFFAPEYNTVHAYLAPCGTAILED